MSETYCPSCGVKIDLHLWRPPLVLEVGMPFWAKRELSDALCPGCNRPVRCDVPSYSPAEPSLWMRQAETLQLGRDFQVLHGAFGSARAGAMPAVCVWAWTPLPGGEYEQMVVDAVASQAKRWDGHRRLLVVPPGRTDWPCESYHEVWQVEPHVLQGAKGPYPSVRAERSLTKTVNPRKFVFYWPSVSLPMTGMQELVGWQDLAKTWARESRRSLQVEVNGAST